MLAECLSSQDRECVKSLESIARANQAPLKDSTCVLLIKCLSSRPWRVRPIVKEALWRESPEFSSELALTILDFCGSSSDKAMADRLFQQMEPKPSNVVVAFIRFYAIGRHCEEACKILESHLPSFHGDYLQSPITGMTDADTAWHIVIAALQCGRVPLAQHIFETAASSTAKHLVLIQKWWRYGYEHRHRENSVDIDSVAEVGTRMSRVMQLASLNDDEDLS